MWGKYAIAPALTLRKHSRSRDTLLLWTTVRDAPWIQDIMSALFVAGITTQSRRFTTGGSFIERQLYAEEGACWHNLPLVASSLL